MKNLKTSIKLKRSMIFLIVALAAYSCKKDNTSIPATKTSQVSFGIKAANSTAVLASTSKLTVNSVTTPVIQFTAGVANITKFKLEAKMVNKQVEIETKNLMNVDLFAITPASVNASLDTGTYKQIEVSVVLSKSADISAIPLKLKGNFTATDGIVVPVEFNINDNITIKAEAKNVVLHNNSDLSTVVLLHLDKIVAGITAADLNAAARTGGVIIISSTSNVNLFNKIKFNVENCGEAEVEHHGNGGGDDGSNHNSGGNDDGSNHGSGGGSDDGSNHG